MCFNCSNLGVEQNFGQKDPAKNLFYNEHVPYQCKDRKCDCDQETIYVENKHKMVFTLCAHARQSNIDLKNMVYSRFIAKPKIEDSDEAETSQATKPKRKVVEEEGEVEKPKPKKAKKSAKIVDGEE